MRRVFCLLTAAVGLAGAAWASDGVRTDSLNLGWEFVLRDFERSYRKVGRSVRAGEILNDNGTTTVALDRNGWQAVDLPHDRRVASMGAHGAFLNFKCDTPVVNVTALDAAGREVPNACCPVCFEPKGAGRLLGVGNGDPMSHEPDVCHEGQWTRNFFNGRCQAVVCAPTAPGDFTLTAWLQPSEKVAVTIRMK